MDTREYDKSSWGRGPWHSEPDRVDFEHAGLSCLLLRGALGAWCGYAAVTTSHPLHGKGYDQCIDSTCGIEYCYEHSPSALLHAHGGLTYADACSGAICHIPKPGEPDDVWWFGFDCGHCDDLVPGMARYSSIPERGIYRDLAYVRAETERLAEQLRDKGEG